MNESTSVGYSYVSGNRNHLRLVPPPPPSELALMARRDPELLAFLRLLHQSGQRREAIALLSKVIAKATH